MLKRALYLRDVKEKYNEAGICLLKAAEEGDSEAMFHLSIAYEYGGWGLEMNKKLANEYLNKSAAAGFRLAGVMTRRLTQGNLTPVEQAFNHFYLPPDNYHEFLPLCMNEKEHEFAQFGISLYNVDIKAILKMPILHKNARVHSYFGARLCTHKYPIDAKRFLTIAHEQKCFMHSVRLVDILINERNYIKAFKIATETKYVDKVILLKDKPKELMYKIGKWALKAEPTHLYDREDIFTERIKCMEFYRFTVQSAQSSILAWSLCAKELGLYKDVTRLISRMVWKLKSDFDD